MGGRWKLLSLGGLAAMVLLAGCGGGGSSETTTERIYPWLKGPSREFLIASGDNAVQTYGREATKAEREQASRVIAAYMRARAAKDFETECRYFSRNYIESLVKQDATIVTHGRVTTCPAALDYFGPAASSDFKNTLDGPIDSLRIREGHGWAQYHGNDGRDWVVPVDKEDGKWLVGIAAPIDRMK
jgi:hypothetical protein